MMRWIALVVSVILVGCAAQPSPAPTPSPTPAPGSKINLSGYPPGFKQGYAEGCASAQPNAARKRDDTRFKTDSSYAQGSQDGYDICRRQK